MDSFFDKALWQQLAATFFGVVAAVPAGLWLNRLAQRREERERKAQSAERQAQLIHALHETLVVNQHYLQAFLDDNDAVLLDGVDLTVLEATASLKYEILGDIGLARDIDKLRASLAEIGEGIKMMVRAQYDAVLHENSVIMDLAQHLRDSITPKSVRFIEMSESILARLGVQSEVRTTTAHSVESPRGAPREGNRVALRH
jgi:hypothetical protein